MCRTEGPGAGRGFGPILAALRSFVSELEPSSYPSGDVPVVMCELAEAEKLCASAKLLMAGRANEPGNRSRNGETDATQVLSSSLGEPAGKSRRDLETARRVARQPDLEEALRQGRISPTQAEVILPAVEADPASASGLIERAGSGSFAELRNSASSVLSAATSEEEALRREARLRSRRHLRLGRTTEGAIYLRGELPLLEGALVRAALEHEARLVSQEARREGRRETHEAHLADALVRLVQDGASSLARSDPGQARTNSRVPRAEIVLHVSAEALRRRSLEPGELCEVAGVGPVPLATLEYLFGSARGKLVVTNGVDIASVTHFGHFIPAHLDTAVRARDRYCVVPGCGIDYGLERDHVVPVEEGGPTELANLAMLCHRHHYLKTHKHWRLTRRQDGSWDWSDTRAGEPRAPLEDSGEPGEPPDEPPDGPPGEPPGGPPSYRQQTLACATPAVVLRLAS